MNPRYVCYARAHGKSPEAMMGLDADDFTFDDTDVKDEDKEEAEEQQRQEWADGVRDELNQKIGECPL